MTGLLEPDAERVQPQGAARAPWRGAVLVAADVAGSILLGAVAIWASVFAVAAMVAFVTWSWPPFPGWFVFRLALLFSTLSQIIFRGTKGL